MGRRGGIQRRRVVFIGVEGKSDRAFVNFLARICDDERLHLHLDVKPGSGGDSVAVVDEAGRRLSRHPDRRAIRQRLVLLDSDRIETDRKAGRDARATASTWGLEVVLMMPKLEGLLIRLHTGHETRAVTARKAETELRKLWPGYEKGSLTSQELKRRFGLPDLKRAAQHDEELRKLLGALELWRKGHVQ